MKELLDPVSGVPRLYFGPEPAQIRARNTEQPIKAVQRASMPAGISRDLGRILRPQAAYRWMLPQVAAITPVYIEMILRGALAGSHVQAWELFDLMEDTWPRLAKNLNEVKRAVVALDWKLFPWQEEDEPPTDSANEKMKVVSNAIWRMRPDPAADENAFRGTVYDIQDACSKGLTVLEIDWEVRQAGKIGNIIAPRSTFWVHPTCYTWSQYGRLGLRTELGLLRENDTQPTPSWPNNVWQSTSFQPMPSMVDDFPPNKFLIGICKAKSGSPLGGALLRSLAWWWCAANFSADWLLNFAQLFGLPFRWATYDPQASDRTISQICDALENMGSNAWAAFPAGTQMELKEAAKGGDSLPQANVIDRADKNCDLIILGQTLTTDVGNSGSRALGEVHQGVRSDVIEAWGEFTAGVLNQQLIPSILRLNYGDDSEAPEFRPEPRRVEDQKANADRDAILLPLMPVPKNWLYKRHDIPLPQEGEETIGGFGGKAPAVPGLDPDGDLTDDEDAADEMNDSKASGGEALKGKATGSPDPSSEFERKALQQFSKALAEDLQPIRSRLEAIQKIQDPDLLQQKLRAFLADILPLTADIGRDPAAAHVLHDILATALVNGMTSGPKPKTGN